MGDAHAAAEIQQADRADDVGDLVIELAVDGRPDTGKRGQMGHRVEGFVGQHSLADVANVERHALWQRILCRDVIESRDPVAFLVEVPDDMAANETRGTGDEDGERFEIHAPRHESTGSPLC